MKRKNILFVVLLVIGTCALATGVYRLRSGIPEKVEEKIFDAKEEYTKIVNAFANHTGTTYAVSGNIKLYDGEHPDTVKENTAFSFAQQGDKFYSVFGPFKVCSNGKYVVQVDTLTKSLSVSKINDQNKAMYKAQNPAAIINDLFNDTATFKVTAAVTTINAGSRKVSFINERTPNIKESAIIYDVKTYAVNNAEIIFWKNQLDHEPKKVWLAKVDYKPSGNQNVDFNKILESIVSISGKEEKIEPAEPYKNYNIRTGIN